VGHPLISLTTKGKAFLDSVESRATEGLASIIEELSPELVDAAILYFRELTSAFWRSKQRHRLRIIESVPLCWPGEASIKRVES
jgi:DNA-binding MarR family transcriptional regulator